MVETLESLVDRLRRKRNDEETFRRLMDLCQDHFFRLAYAVLHDRALALDAVQEAFIKLYQKIPQIHLRQKNVRPFLTRLVINVSIDLYRRKRVYERTFPTSIYETYNENVPQYEIPQEPLTQTLERRELGEEVQTVLLSLPYNFRLTLSLCDMDGQSAEEIAEAMGTKPATVRWRLFKARELFREKWAQKQQKKKIQTK